MNSEANANNMSANVPDIGLTDEALFRTQSYINGNWCMAANSERIDVSDPATQSLIASVPDMDVLSAGKAVDCAQEAFEGWAARLPQDRGTILRSWFDLIIASKEDLARIMVAEQGKPISEARGEIDYAASFIEYYAEEAKRPNIEGVTSHLESAEVEVWREPVGVAALITPWNFPAAMLTRKAAAALAAGCTIVAHPSSETPFSALALAELAARAGMPAGVFNIVTGRARQIVPAWTADPRVRVLSFTGSTEVGRLLYKNSADTIKNLVMELGGHAPFIVFADTDLDHVVDCAISAKFATSGQDCLGANRFLVERSVYDRFCEKFTAKAKGLTVGPGSEDPDLGPLMNRAAVAKQIEHVQDALAKGATLLTGGQVHEAGELFFQPTILSDVSPDALILSEETFGPVAAITAFEDEDEALRRSNDTEYGLVAYLHSNDPNRIYRLSRALQYGMVAVNRTKVTGAPIPFGGVKQSGLGREGAKQGMEAFTEIKYICRNWT